MYGCKTISHDTQTSLIELKAEQGVEATRTGGRTACLSCGEFAKRCLSPQERHAVPTHRRS